MAQEPSQKPQVQIMELIKATPPALIGDLEFVQKKFIANYNFCHKGGIGELVYHRQVNHFKQLIAGSDALKKVDPFSLYACFVTCAVNDYDLDPASMEVFLYPRDGKAFLQRQAGAHVKRLRNSGQIVSADQAKLVYEGDEYEVDKGRVIKHIEKFKSEIFIAGYVRFVLDTRSNDKYFTYRKSDWLDWRIKSPQKDGPNWNTSFKQPLAAFLRTKLVLHAAMDKSWATGNRPFMEDYGVEIDPEDAEFEELKGKATLHTDDNSFAEDITSEVVKETVVHNDDDF